MTGLLIAGIVVYVLVAACAARMIAGHLAWQHWEQAPDSYIDQCLIRRWKGTAPTSGQRADAWFAAILLVAIWPLAIAGWAAKRLERRLLHVGAERRADLRARQQHVRELEQQLGIDKED